MSDISTGTAPAGDGADTGTSAAASGTTQDPAAPPTIPPASTGTASDPSPLEQRVTALEQRVGKLESSSQSKVGFTVGLDDVGRERTFTRTHGQSFDAQARREELVGQGLSEQDANEQAAYEERLWNDQNQGGVTPS